MEFNNRQFRQPAIRGYGDQAMRSYRVAPASQPPSAPALPSHPQAQGHQLSLFQAEEVRNPQGPGDPTFNADQFRISRPALPGMSTRSMASQRVASAPPPPDPAPEPSAGRWFQPSISMLGPTPSSPHSPGAAGPSPTHWPTPASDPTPTPRMRTTAISGATYRDTSLRFGPEPPSPDPEPVAPRTPAVPSRPSTPPAMPSARPAGPTTAGRAATLTGLAVGLGSRALESVTRVAADPKRSGNPLYKTTQGWSTS